MDEQLDETTFDDVAMILLFFFLVLIFFVFAKEYFDVTLEETKIPKPVEKTPLIKTHRDTDGLIYINENQGISVRNLGGIPDSEMTIDIRGDADPSAEGWFTTERESTSKKLAELLMVYYERAEGYGGQRGGRSRTLRFYVGSHSEGRYGPLHQVTRALGLLKHTVKNEALALLVDVRPCPVFDNGLDLVEQLHKYNACVYRTCGPGQTDPECLKNYSIMMSCEGEAGLKRNDIVKEFCRWYAPAGGEGDE